MAYGTQIDSKNARSNAPSPRECVCRVLKRTFTRLARRLNKERPRHLTGDSYIALWLEIDDRLFLFGLHECLIFTTAEEQPTEKTGLRAPLNTKTAIQSVSPNNTNKTKPRGYHSITNNRKENYDTSREWEGK